MSAYIFILAAIFCLWFINSRVKFTFGNRTRLVEQNKAYVIRIGVLIFLVAALRNYTVGMDVINYLNRYTRFANAEWKDIFRIADGMKFEHGFAVMNKLLSHISNNPRFLLIITAFLVIFSFCLAIYKNSPMPWFSFFLFITLGLFGASLSALRQYIAIAIILFSYESIRKNNLVEFIVLVILAYFIHASALFILPMYWLSKIKFNKVIIFAILATLLGGVFLFFRNAQKIGTLIAPYIFTYSKYFTSLEASIGKGAIGATLIYTAFLVLIIMELYDSESPSRNMYIAFAIVTVMLILFSFVIGVSARIVYNFSSMFIFSIPEAIVNEKKRRIRIQYLIIICIVMIIYYLAIICRADTSSLIPYEFWNNKYIIY